MIMPHSTSILYSTRIILIRHTDVHNPDDILYGRLPRFRLSSLGLEQAQRTAQALAEEPVTAFYSSPQLRARQTARILAAAHPGSRVSISSLLNEVRTGWQGRPHSELDPINFDFYANPLSSEDERLEDMWARITRFVALMRRRHAGETVVGVTHGDVCHLARAGYVGLPIDISSIRLPHVYPGKGSLTRLRFSTHPKETYPLSVEYYDPNDGDTRAAWSHGWVEVPAEGIKYAELVARD